MRKYPKQELQKRNSTIITNSVVDPFTPLGGGAIKSLEPCWSWGTDNMLPYALALMSRHSTTHRRIINDKADYISGRGFVCDLADKRLESLVNCANGDRETLRSILNKVAFDKCLFGNAFLEIVTNPKKTFLSFYHQDASRCRVSKDRNNIILHHDWNQYTAIKAKSLPLYPRFEQMSDGTIRSLVHYKDYEPLFENYGIPPYIAGLGVSAIAYKTDRWNISRLDNSFQLSGVMVLDGNVDSDEAAIEISRRAEKKFSGKPGQVMFLVKNTLENEGSKFVPIASNNDGDWKSLHEQATTDIVVAHSWFRALSGLDYATGFSPERIIHEYNIALNTLILAEQVELMEPIRGAIEGVLGINTESLSIINRPPVQLKPSYMCIWEARKADGLDFDPNDPMQQNYLANITKISNDTDNTTRNN